MTTKALFTRKSDEWMTPQWLVDWVHKFLPIGLDPCTTPANPVRALKYYTKQDNGKTGPWWDVPRGHCVYVNPPYSDVSAWVDRVCQEKKHPLLLLVPARVDTKWWHQMLDRATSVLFFRGRLKFSERQTSAPFPSALVGFHMDEHRFTDAFHDLGWVVNTELRER